jgi:hypothetical protein
MNPGHTALILMPDLAYSSADDFVSPATPCLLATYAVPPGKPLIL